MIALLSIALGGELCDAWTGGLVQGPGRAGLLDGDLGRARAPCLRDSVGFAGGGYVLADAANFYGHITAAGTLSASHVFAPRWEASASVEVLRYETVIAPLTVSYLGLGTTTAGVAWQGGQTERFAWAMDGRLVVPTSSGLYQNAFPYGLHGGMSLAWAPRPWLEVHGQWSVIGSFAVSEGPAYPRMGLALDGGAAWRPGKAFAFGLDLVGTFGHTAPVDVFGVAPAFRFGLGEHLGLSLEATVPLAGTERALAAADLRADWRF